MATINVRRPNPTVINKFLGLNMDTSGETQLKLGESPNMLNFQITENLKLRKRPGYTLVADEHIAIKGMWAGYIDDIYSFVYASDGREPASTVNPGLPPLKITSALPEQFNINLSLDIPLSYINSLARTSMRGYTMSYGRYKVIVKDITIYGQGDKLIVELPVDGTVKGTIYLAGAPVFNKDSLTIEMTNLDFSVATKNVAIKTASWLFHSPLVQKLRSKLVFPVGEQLRSACSEVAATLRENRSIENFRINGSIDRLDPEKIQITSGSVKAYFVLTGRVRVVMNVD